MIKIKKIKGENNTNRRRRSVERKRAPTLSTRFIFPQEHLNVTAVKVALGR